MKTPEQLASDLLIDYNTNRYVKLQQMYNMQPSGDIFADFCKFTDLQSGGKSDNKTDYYYLNTVNPAPPIPFVNGRYYHTVRDITWQLFKHLVADDANRFYNMTDADREIVVKFMTAQANITKSEVVNSMFSYAVWGTGNCQSEKTYYAAWYKTNLNDDIDALGEQAILDRITDIRLYVLSTFTTTANNPGQPAGVLNLWSLLKQY